MAEYPIIMKQKNDQGDYDVLYPKTLGSQVSGNIQSSQIEGNIPSSQITGTFPASQITDLPTSLPANGGNADTVGGQTAQQIIQSALAQGMKVETGSYVGTGSYGQKSLTFNFSPKIIFIYSKISSYGNKFVYSTFYQNNPNYIGYCTTETPMEVYFGYGTSNISNNTLTWQEVNSINLIDGNAGGNIIDQILNMNFSSGTYYYIAIS